MVAEDWRIARALSRGGGLKEAWSKAAARFKAPTGEGRERAKGRGVRFGRPLKLSPHQRREAIERLDAGEAVVDVARTFGVDRATLYRLRAEVSDSRPV
jgi:DNA invertase Pin-like site-specific DNA recombinase